MTGLMPALGARPSAPPALDVVVYDIEIMRCIPARGEPRQADLEYCAGWHDHANMGIAVLCAFDTRAMEPRVFLQENLGDFQALIQGRMVAGYNNHGFDDRLLAANGITVGESWDLLAEVRAAVGESRAFTPGRTRGGRKLDDLSARNLGTVKSMSGALAPVQWQRGQRGHVIDYCMRDVMLTLKLMRRLPRLFDPVTGAQLDVAPPVSADQRALSEGREP